MSSSAAAPPPSGQLQLPLAYDPALLRNRLECFTGQTLTLKITDNTTSMLSLQKKEGRSHLRLHRMFLRADEGVLKAVAGFIAGENNCGPVIRKYIKEFSSALADRSLVRPALRPHGNSHCLREVFDRVNRTYFAGQISAGITWGKNRHGRGGRRITLGSFCRANNTIRINPLLDRKSVPLFFLEFIVYHEMLHADLGFSNVNGRRRLHTKEFRTRERLFAAYDRALAWEKKYL